MIRPEAVWEAFPAGSYAVCGLMRLLDIQESREVETAALVQADAPVILVNPDFAARYARTPERQAALILHELLHLLLGHQLRPMTKIDNFIFDALINAMVCFMTREPSYWSLFTSYYSSRRFPECLLRPPVGFRMREPGFWTAVYVPRVLRGSRMWKARQVYQALYNSWGTTYTDVLRLFDILVRFHGELLRGVDREMADGMVQEEGTEGLRRQESIIWADEEAACEWEEPEELPDRVPSLDELTLLGSHPALLQDDEICNEDLAREVSAALAPMNSRLPHRSQEEMRYQLNLQIPAEVESRNSAALTRLIEKVAYEGHAAARSVRENNIRLLTAVPAMDRRSNVLRFLGLEPLLYGWEMPERQRRRITPVHVYLDVSGSATPFIASLCKAVLACKELVSQRVHLFSTRIEDMQVRRLAAGQIPSWGGTDIRCVLEHMKFNDIQNAVILTDGYVGKPDACWEGFLRECCIAVALTPGGSLSDLGDFVRHHVRLVRD
ncbi:MAG: hypothetical protein KatS3mg005_1147 [Bryobacteraceae bacterium]|nr:MAG: hypothetical protein KatS3mg005_1147 [Bryobacteraceae bacterium]